MNFSEKIEIENNVTKYILKAQYNDTLTDEESAEIEMLHDYPKKIKLSDINFSANVSLSNGTPVVATTVTGEASSASTVAITLDNIAPKEYMLDENLEISFSVDAKRIADSETDTSVLTTKPLVAQAKIAVFQSKLKSEISRILTIVRNENNNFESESEIIM